MSDSLVKAFDAEGNRVLVPIDKVDELADLGGRVASDQDIAQAKLAEKYARSSTASKIVGAVTGTNLPPELQAWQAGGAAGLSAGTYHGLVRQAVDEIAGKKAGNAFEQHVRDLKTGHEGTYTAGEIGGMIGGAAIGAASGAGAAGAAARFLPGAGISAVGTAVEAGTARLLGGVAARGVAGRAVSTAASLGAQGLVEGALYGAGQEVGEQMLVDHDVAADRVFAATGMGALYGALGGAALGGGGSLLRSGGGAAVRGARGGIARMGSAAADAAGSARSALREGELLGRRAVDDAGQAVARAGEDVAQAARQGVREAADNTAAGGKALADATGTSVAQEGATAAKTWGTWKKAETQKGWAYDLAFNQVGAGNGLQSTRFVKEAKKYFKEGPRDLGEIAVRHGLIDVKAGVLDAAENSMPDAILARAQKAADVVGARIGEITESSGARIGVDQIDDAIRRVRDNYAKKAGFEHIVGAVDDYRRSLYKNLGLQAPGAELEALLATQGQATSLEGLLRRGQGSANDVLRLDASVQEVLAQRKALDQLVYQEAKSLDPKLRVQAMRDVRAEMEGLITNVLDDASGKVKGELAAEYKALKRDFHGLRILTDLAEDSAARQAKSATFGLTDTLRSSAGASIGAMVAGPLGGAVGGLAGGLASKFVRERGNAAAAVLLYRMAEMGTITRAMQSVEQQVNRSAKGLLNPAPATRAATPARDPIKLAKRAQIQIAGLTSSPNAVADRTTTLTQGLSTTAPTVAGKVATNMTRALAFLNSKLPPNRNVDPLAPNQPRSWTQTEAERFSRYVEAAEDPIGTLQDIERGKVTPEAVETLRVLTPTLYRDLQLRTLDAIAEQLATGKPVSFEARIKVGTLLGIQADPSQNPRVRAFLQNNVAAAAAAASAGGSMQPAPTGPAPRPIQIKTQHSAFDRLAEGGPGRR